jgi:plastocyanin
MRKGMSSAAAAFVVLLSGAGVFLGIPRATAADSQVKMVEGSSSDYTTWKFAPEEITVPVGSTVVWHNDGSQQHTATAEDKSFASPYLNKGQDFQFKFAAPGDFKYYCEPHKALGMVGVIHVTGASTPTTPATTATTQPASSATTATTAVGSASTTTTTAKAGSGSPTTTTATTAAGGSTTTTLASALTPTSAPDSASSTTTTTTAAGSSGEGAQAAHEGSKNDKSSPVGIAFAAVATLLLGAVSVRLLASKP